MTSSRRPRRSAAQWQHLISQQAASGLAAPAFCERHDLSYASFIQWRRRLRESEPSVVAEPPSPQTMPFIELTATRELSCDSEHWLIELDLGSGVQLRIAQPR